MPEQFANLCQTLVAGGYTAGSGVLNVDSTAAPWPQTGTFRVTLCNKDTQAPIVVLKVTARNSATQWAVAAESPDTSASEDDIVYGSVLTAGAISQLRKDMLRFGAWANLPAAGDAHQGDLYLPTDFGFYDLCYFDGSNWIRRLDGCDVTLPVPGDFAWDNQGSCTNTTRADGSVLLSQPAGQSSINTHLYKRSYPAAPFKMTFAIAKASFAGNYMVGGIGIANSTGHSSVVLHCPCGPTTRYSGHTSWSADLGNYLQGFYHGTRAIWAQYEDNNTNRIWRIGMPGAWSQVDSRSRTETFTPDEIGILLNGYNNLALDIVFLHLKVE